MNFKKKTRYSVGGIHFNNKKPSFIEFECDMKLDELIDQIDQISSYGKGQRPISPLSLHQKTGEICKNYKFPQLGPFIF